MQLTDEQVEKKLLKGLLEKDHLAFTSYFFLLRHGLKFRTNWHHLLLTYYLEQVLQGKIKNLVINIAPGSSKTELAVINFMARGLAINHMARYLHISYSDDLALLNSQEARNLVETDEFQDLWPMRISDDTKAKKRWNVVVKNEYGLDKKAGGCYAVSLGGQITGFRAGHMALGWQGAIIIDDPLKVEDAYSKLQRDKANRKLVSTVRSRRAFPDTPTIVIMQRVATEDCTGFIMEGHLGKNWTYVTIPALIDDNYIKTLPAAIQEELLIEETVDGAEYDSLGRRSYWPTKEPLADLLEYEKGNRYSFSGQYMQNPTALGGNLIMGKWFVMYLKLPQILYRLIFADTAQKTGERNDYSVFECWGMGADKKIYLLDMIRGKWEAPELKRRAIAFWNQQKEVKDVGQLREMLVEDKSSGTGLVQEIRTEGAIPVKPIERVKDKLTRLMDVIPYIEVGNVCLPLNASFTNDFVMECEAFTPDDTHLHDDQVDPLIDAINNMLGSGNALRIWEKFVSR